MTENDPMEYSCQLEGNLRFEAGKFLCRIGTRGNDLPTPSSADLTAWTLGKVGVHLNTMGYQIESIPRARLLVPLPLRVFYLSDEWEIACVIRPYQNPFTLDATNLRTRGEWCFCTVPNDQEQAERVFYETGIESEFPASVRRGLIEQLVAEGRAEWIVAPSLQKRRFR